MPYAHNAVNICEHKFYMQNYYDVSFLEIFCIWQIFLIFRMIKLSIYIVMQNVCHDSDYYTNHNILSHNLFSIVVVYAVLYIYHYWLFWLQRKHVVQYVLVKFNQYALHFQYFPVQKHLLHGMKIYITISNVFSI